MSIHNIEKFVDVFFVELREVMKFGVVLLVVLIDIVFVLGGIICLVEWVAGKVRSSRSYHDDAEF